VLLLVPIPFSSVDQRTAERIAMGKPICGIIIPVFYSFSSSPSSCLFDVCFGL
jgi:hypothetical protein